MDSSGPRYMPRVLPWIPVVKVQVWNVTMDPSGPR